MMHLLSRGSRRERRASNEAAGWILRHDGAALGEQERAEFHRWLAASAANRKAFRDAQRAWSAADSLRLTITQAPRAQVTQRVRWRTAYAAAAATALVVLVLSSWIFLSLGTRTYRTGVGEFSRVVLEDGSTVNLNTDTVLRVRLERRRRSLELVHGEAAFTVAHDAARPFDVRANGTLVRALGTVFNVKVAGADAVEVTVSQGRVLVANADVDSVANAGRAGPTVAAGEIALAKPAGIAVRRAEKADVSRRLAWLDGEVELQGEPLVEAVEEFNHYSRKIKLRVGDASISDLQVGGRFRSTDIESFVQALEVSFGVRARREGDVIVLVPGSASEDRAIAEMTK